MYEFETPLALYIDGQKHTRFVRYHFSRGVFEQPASFSFTIGSGDLARELLRKYRPLMKVELRLEGNEGNRQSTKLFTGVIEDISSNNSGGATEVTLQGRDMLYRLVKNYVVDEKSFGQATYAELTKEVLKRAGYPETQVLVYGNEDNRVASLRAGVSLKKPSKRNKIELEQTNLVSASGAKVAYEKVVGQIGESHFDFLMSQLKKAGLYVMCGADGQIILMIPDNQLSPSYALRRWRGIKKNEPGTILTHDYQNRTSQRHAQAICYGKGRPDKDGQRQGAGNQVSTEMTKLGFDADTDCFVMHNDDAKTLRDREYFARRHMAEETRRNRTLKYTTPGHLVMGLDTGGRYVPWTPDTVVTVNDDELCWPDVTGDKQRFYGTETWQDAAGIQEDCYIERVDFDMDARNGTTSTLTVLRWNDLLWFSEDPTTGTATGESQQHG